jgi:hypothetical protein
MRVAMVVLGVLSIVAIPTAVARADEHPVALSPGYVQSTPTLEGGSVAWLESRCVRQCFEACGVGGSTEEHRIRQRLATGGTRTLFRTRTPCASNGGPSYGYAEFSFAGSDGWLALQRVDTSADEFSEDISQRLFAGRASRKLAPIQRCGSVRSPYRPAFALTGSTLVYDATPCATTTRALVVRDLAGGGLGEIPQPQGTKVSWIRAAGPFVAIRRSPADGVAQTEVSVHDLRARSDVLTVPSPAGRYITGFDVQADGKLVAASRSSDARTGACGGDQLAWYQPGDEEAHTLDVGPCETGVRIDRDRIVFLRGRLRHNRVLSVTTLAGSARDLVRFGRFPVFEVEADASRVAYDLPTCAARDAIFVRSIAARSTSAGSPSCPLRLPAQRLVFGHDGRAAVRLRCVRGCAGILRLKAHGRIVARGAFQAHAGRAASGRVRLTDTGRRLLARRPTSSARLTVRTRDRLFRVRSLTRTLGIAA